MDELTLNDEAADDKSTLPYKHIYVLWLWITSADFQSCFGLNIVYTEL
jgi:hypothetical protein